MNHQHLAFDLQAQAYVKASFLTILVYDWLITLSDEIFYIWHSKWGIIKILFIYTRYGTFVDTILAFRDQVVGAPKLVPVCGTTFQTVFSGLGMSICALILMIWTYTLFERSRRVLAIFGLSWLIIGGIAGWATFHFVQSTPASVPPSDSSGMGNLGCHVSQMSNLRYLLYALLLGGEAVVVLLTVGKALRMAGVRSLTRLWKVFNECGVHYYLGILAFTTTQVILLFITPDGIWDFDSPLRVMHTVFTCRLVLHLRKFATEKLREKDSQFQSVGSQIRSLGDLESCHDGEDSENRRLMIPR